MSIYDQRRKLSMNVQEDNQGGTSVLPIPRSKEREHEQVVAQNKAMTGVQKQVKEKEFGQQLLDEIKKSPEAQARVDQAMAQIAELVNSPEMQGMDKAAMAEMIPQLLQGGA